jgi:hypothetical protein
MPRAPLLVLAPLLPEALMTRAPLLSRLLSLVLLLLEVLVVFLCTARRMLALMQM